MEGRIYYQGENCAIIIRKNQTTGKQEGIKISAKGANGERFRYEIENEYNVLQDLSIDGIKKVKALTTYEDGPALLFDFQPGMTIRERLKTKTKTERLLKWFVALAETLLKLHEEGIAHGFITPDNIIVSDSDEITLVDFGHSFKVRKGAPLNIQNGFRGSQFPYISPEQTGRTGKSIDHRTDFYSLGITLYELIEGKLPYDFNGLQELVYHHLTQPPAPLSDKSLSLFPALGEVVVKLLKKDPKERYQSAFGLREDLERILSGDRSFTPGELDFSPFLELSDKLYGRTRELKKLEQKLKAARQGSFQYLWIKGPSGSGKSSLIRKFRETNQDITYIEGKFEQLNRKAPYSALTQAFTALAEKLLLSDEDFLLEKREVILAALGPNARIIADLVPKFETALGPVGKLDTIAPVENQNRFVSTLQQFLHIMGEIFSPLVVFIDDLQWADPASLLLLKEIIKSNHDGKMLLLGSFRNDEIGKSGPLARTLKELDGEGENGEEIVLSNLKMAEIAELLCETLGLQTKPFGLARYVLNITEGNPFFVREYINYLYNEGQLFIKQSADIKKKGQWSWKIKRANQVNFNGDILELLSAKAREMSSESYAVLAQGAVLGVRFGLSPLQDLTGLSETKLLEHMSEAIKYNFITLQERDGLQSQKKSNLQNRNETEFIFTHDRFQQIAISKLTERERENIHLQIVKQALDRPLDEEQMVFNLAHHIIESIDLIKTEMLVDKPLQILTNAGGLAIKNTSYDFALSCYSNALLISNNSKEDHYQLLLEKANTEFLCRNFDLAEKELLKLKECDINKTSAVRVHDVLCQLYQTQGKWNESLDIGVEGLKAAGITVYQGKRLEQECNSLYNQILTCSKNQTEEDLLSLPVLTDNEGIQTRVLLLNMGSPAYVINHELFPFIIYKALVESINNGNSGLSSIFYILFGRLETMGGRYKTGYLFAHLGLKLAQRLNEQSLICNVNFSFGQVNAWHSPLRNNIPIYEEGYLAGKTNGNMIYGSFNGIVKIFEKLAMGYDLRELKEESLEVMRYLKKANNLPMGLLAKMVLQTVDVLMEGPVDVGKIEGSIIHSEKSLLKELKKTNFSHGLHYLYLRKCELYILSGRLTKARKYIGLASEFAEGASGQFSIAELYFYETFLLVLLFTKQQKRSPSLDIRKRIKNNILKLREWSKNCPENFRQMYLIVVAEKERAIDNNPLSALKKLEEAMGLSHRNNFPNYEGLASLRGASLCRDIGLNKLAQSFLHNAVLCYDKWNAKAVSGLIHSLYGKPDGGIGVSIVPEPTPIAQNLKGLDLSSFIKSSSILFSKLDLKELLKSMSEVIMENAGAQYIGLARNINNILVLSQYGAKGNIMDQTAPLTQNMEEVPVSILNYAHRTGIPVALGDAQTINKFSDDPYLKNKRPRSVLCYPVKREMEVLMIVYLENNDITDAFTEERIEVLNALSAQMIIAYENAGLYDEMEFKIKKRTKEISVKNDKLTELNKALADSNNELEQALFELKEAQHQLVQAEKMASLGTLTSGIAHEINNPLNFVSGGLEAIKEGVSCLTGLLEIYSEKEGADGEPEIKEYKQETDFDRKFKFLLKSIDIAERGTERTTQIVKGLLGFANSSNTQIEYDLQEGIDSTIMLIKHNISEDIKIISNIKQAVLINCVPGKLNQVLMNLIMNAAQAIPDRGTIEINCKPFDSEGRPFIRLEIKDDGDGMDREQQKKIFEPFYTTKPTGKGTGLGLWISHSIIEEHEGNILVKSRKGKGTTLIIELPKEGIRSNVSV